MEDLANLFHGFTVVLQPDNIMLMFIGILLGVLIGILPGLGGANGVAILLPLTFGMSPTSAIIMLSCIYWGALFGGAITSILFNIPGEPGRSQPPSTAIRWHSREGRRSAHGRLHLVVRRRAVRRDHDHAGAPLVAKFALQFGPAEKFAVFFLAFCSFIGMGKEPPFKTIAAMMIGFALAAVGLDSMTGSCVSPSASPNCSTASTSSSR